MSDLYSNESLSEVSENSFIILGPSSLVNEANDKELEEGSKSEALVSGKTPTTFWDLTQSNDDSKCSFSEGSIQEKLNDLVKENYQLKETLSQNNLAIKSQLDTFFLWQQEVLKTHENHRQTFLQTKDLILKLQMENLSLKKQLEEFSFVSVGDISDEGNMAPEGSDRLEKKIRELENKCDELVNKNQNLDTENQKLVVELASAKEEIVNLKKELEKESVENIEQWKAVESQFAAKASAEMTELLKQPVEKNKELELEPVPKKVKSSDKEASVLIKNVTDLVNESVGKLNDVENMITAQRSHISYLLTLVTKVEKIFEKNKTQDEDNASGLADLLTLKCYLDFCGNDFEEEKKCTQKIKREFTELLENFKTTEKQSTLLRNELETIVTLKEEITSLSTELQTKNTELTSKQKECNELKEEIVKSNAEWSEKVNALQIQVNLYQNDIYCECEAKEKLSEENEKLIQEIGLYQIQFEEFKKFNGGINGVGGLSLWSQPRGTEPYKCPQCLNSFSDLRSCEEHVNDCLGAFM